jgi:hypothetical protein
MSSFLKHGVIAMLLSFSNICLAATPATVRLDYMHTGNAKTEQYALSRVLIEPLPWPGNLQQNIDTSNRGVNKVEVSDLKTGELIYSRGFQRFLVNGKVQMKQAS